MMRTEISITRREFRILQPLCGSRGRNDDECQAITVISVRDIQVYYRLNNEPRDRITLVIAGGLNSVQSICKNI